jgi:hypothetical protein
MFTGFLGRVGARILAFLRLDTSLRTVLASYLIVVMVRSTVTVAVAVLPALIKVRLRLLSLCSQFANIQSCT